MASVSLTEVVKRFGSVEVIHGASLDIRDGEFVVFVGPSGCGKSTLLRMIAGLERTSGGEISIGEQVVNDVPARHRGVAMVFQSYALYPHMTVAENMAFGLRNLGTPRAEIEARVADAARTLQITHLLDRRPKDMSGGQRQRVAIGRAIVRQPEVFLFDEPLSNLDAALRVTMRTELAKLHRKLGATMIFVTHDQTEAMTMADRIVVLRDGRVEQVGAPLELYDRPANLFVAGFLGSPKMNLLEGTRLDAPGDRVVVGLEGGGEVAGYARPPIAPGEKLTAGIRPEHLRLADDGPLTGHIDVVEHLGNLTLVYLTLAGGAAAVVETRGNDVQPGDRVRLAVDPRHVQIFRADGAAVTDHAAAMAGGRT